MAKVTGTAEHAGCEHGSTCLLRGATKQPASLEEIQHVMRVVNTETGLKAYHDCRRCIREVTGMHTCSFAGCTYETDQKSNLTTHENRRHVGFRTHCETDECQFTWADYSAYSKHKERVHGLHPVRRNKPHEIGYAGGKKRSQSERLQNNRPQRKRPRKESMTVRRIVAREDFVLSEAGSYYPTDSSGWSATAAFNLTPALSASNVLWSPSSDFTYPSITPPSSQLYTAATSNQYAPPLSSTSASPYYNLADLSHWSDSSSAGDTSLTHWP